MANEVKQAEAEVKAEETLVQAKPVRKSDPRIKEIVLNGLIFQNPILVLFLGMCSTLAVSTSLTNALGMGLSTTIVLIFSNVVISLLRKAIPKEVRIACYVVIIAGFVTIVELCLKAFLPALSESLGIFIPLIVVNWTVSPWAWALPPRCPLWASSGSFWVRALSLVTKFCP